MTLLINCWTVDTGEKFMYYQYCEELQQWVQSTKYIKFLKVTQ